MFNKLTQIFVLCVMQCVFLSGVGFVQAGVTSGSLFYTRYAGAGANVKSVTFSYDDAAPSFTLGTPSDIGSTFGADGISGNPQNSDLLFVGGQGRRINTINKSTGTAISYVSPVDVFHLEVLDSVTLLGSGIPGALAKHTINGDGSLSAGTTIALSGSDTTLTQVITTPSGTFFTASFPAGHGTFGTIDLTSGTTTRLHGPGGSVGTSTLPGAHGGVYDPFTDSIIVSGDNHVTQIALDGTILSDAIFSGGPALTFDQLSVDGNGHAFVASNSGHLAFIDYATSGLVGSSTYSSVQFLDTFLDDVAPLIGAGGTGTGVVPEPTSAVGWSLVLFLATCARRRKDRVG